MIHSSLVHACLERWSSLACFLHLSCFERSVIGANPKIGLPTLFVLGMKMRFRLVIMPQAYQRWRVRGITDVSHPRQIPHFLSVCDPRLLRLSFLNEDSWA